MSVCMSCLTAACACRLCRLCSSSDDGLCLLPDVGRSVSVSSAPGAVTYGGGGRSPGSAESPNAPIPGLRVIAWAHRGRFQMETSIDPLRSSRTRAAVAARG